jgi:hypothetical protein
MDCIFRILTKDKELFESLKKEADGWSKKGLIIFNNIKCYYFYEFEDLDIEMLVTPFRIEEGVVDGFYFDGELKDINEEILEKFDMQKYEPIIWKEWDNDEIPF